LVDAFPPKRPAELANLLDANKVSGPALALDNPALTISYQLKIDATIGVALSASLVHRPALPPEHLANEPLEFLGGQMTKVSCPFD